jgi:hypothetical protein
MSSKVSSKYYQYEGCRERSYISARSLTGLLLLRSVNFMLRGDNKIDVDTAEGGISIAKRYCLKACRE